MKKADDNKIAFIKGLSKIPFIVIGLATGELILKDTNQTSKDK